MAESSKITPEYVCKIEDALEERKASGERRQIAMKLPKALERRTSKERRRARLG